jgi:hypothetical protein
MQQTAGTDHQWNTLPPISGMLCITYGATRWRKCGTAPLHNLLAKIAVYSWDILFLELDIGASK